MKERIAIFWFRRDLRLTDNAGLYHALKNEEAVLPLFIFDRNILDKLDNKSDRRVEFINYALEDIQQKHLKLGSSLEVFYGQPVGVFQQLLSAYQLTGVYTNADYEPDATERDRAVSKLLAGEGVPFHAYKD
jgi:deoxyribodipyrimidine photo-lyase